MVVGEVGVDGFGRLKGQLGEPRLMKRRSVPWRVRGCPVCTVGVTGER